MSTGSTMNVDSNVVDAFSRFTGKKRSAEPETPPLKGGSGDGTSGGMEARIAKLEAQMEGVRADLNKLSGVPVDLARVDERVKHLPGKGFVVTTTTTSLALLAAVILFADKLRAIITG
jgi:hypothetical protein